MPALAKVSVARPSAPVSSPPTLAPASGSAGGAVGHLDVEAWPVVAAVGPVRCSAWAFEKASNAHSTSSPGADALLAAAHLRGLEFTNWPQNCDRVAESGPIAVDQEVLEAVVQVPSQVKPPSLAPSSSAAVEVGPGVRVGAAVGAVALVGAAGGAWSRRGRRW